MDQSYLRIFVFVFEEHPGATKFVQTQPRLPGRPGFNSHPRNFSIANPSSCFLMFLKNLGRGHHHRNGQKLLCIP